MRLRFAVVGFAVTLVTVVAVVAAVIADRTAADDAGVLGCASGSSASMLKWRGGTYAGWSVPRPQSLPKRGPTATGVTFGCPEDVPSTASTLVGVPPQVALAARNQPFIYLRDDETIHLIAVSSHPLHSAYYRSPQLPRLRTKRCRGRLRFAGRVSAPTFHSDKIKVLDGARIRTVRIDAGTQASGAGAAPTLRPGNRVQIVAIRCGKRRLLAERLRREP